MVNVTKNEFYPTVSIFLSDVPQTNRCCLSYKEDKTDHDHLMTLKNGFKSITSTKNRFELYNESRQKLLGSGNQMQNRSLTQVTSLLRQILKNSRAQHRFPRLEHVAFEAQATVQQNNY